MKNNLKLFTIAQKKVWIIVLFSLILTKGYGSCPNVYSISGTINGCSGNITLSSSDAGVTYELLMNSNSTGILISGNGGPLVWTITEPATYTVNAAQGGCASVLMSGSYNATITVVNTYSVTGGGTYCQQSGNAAVGLSNSDNRVSYSLLRNGTSYDQKTGNGQPISWTNLSAGTYTISASYGACTVTMYGSATVILLNSPRIYASSGGGSYCGGGTPLNVSLSNSDIGVNYQLTFQGNNVNSPIAGTGTAISWTNLAPTANGSYSVQASQSACPSVLTAMSGSPSVTYLGQGPQVFNVSGTANYCPDSPGSVGVTLSGSTSGVTYKLISNGHTLTSLSGTGSALTWSNPGAGAYTITASNSSCSNTMAGTATLTSSPIPKSYIASGGGSYWWWWHSIDCVAKQFRRWC